MHECHVCQISMKRENVVAIIGIPQNFARDIMAGAPTAMNLVANGAFISGNLFPARNIPAFMRAFAWLLPSTPGSTGMVRASQAGASLAEVMPYLARLATLAIAYFLLALLACHVLRNRAAKF